MLSLILIVLLRYNQYYRSCAHSVLYHHLITDIPVYCLLILIINSFHCYLPRRRRPGTGDIATPPVCLSVRPSVCLSVTFSFRTVTQKRIDVFSRNFAGTCTMTWGVCCIVFDIDGMLFEFFMNFLNIEKNIILRIFFQYFIFSSCFMLFPTLKKNLV